ncbi:MAG: class I SAM-dependent methyltransferase [Rhizobiales bacterium]|nr:class I SAM-dependent methyltransferase [Hyphomicrobiales bacterium]
MTSHSAKLAFAALNDGKANFDDIYVSADPRRYFGVLGQLDYIIPHLAQPVFGQLIQARAEQQDEPVTVLDLGCSYGVNGALMKYALGYDAIRERYVSPHLQSLKSEELTGHDRAFYRAWPKNESVRVIGLDVSERAIRYAEESGAIDLGYALDLERDDPSPEQAEQLAKADIIVSTGCVGYVTSKTFHRLAKLARKAARHGSRPFVLQNVSLSRDRADALRAGAGHRAFRGGEFRAAALCDARRNGHHGACRGIARSRSLYRREADGFFPAELFVPRPQSEIRARAVARYRVAWSRARTSLGRSGRSVERHVEARAPHRADRESAAGRRTGEIEKAPRSIAAPGSSISDGLSERLK